MRKFALVVFGNDNTIVDRYNLDIVSEPSGFGFKLNLSLLQGDIEDIITKVVQVKGQISLKINHVKFPYLSSNVLTQWIEKYSRPTQRLGLEYDDTLRKRYCVGKVVDFAYNELNEFGALVDSLTFKPITPFFTNVENLIKIEVSAYGKSYPFKYPYSYGRATIMNNEINNPYIADIPLTITINGGISEPQVQLLDENNIYYNRVLFSGLTLTKGQRIIINSAINKIYYFNGITTLDYTPEVDPRYDTFLRAKSGRSSININSADSGDGFSLVGSWWQYGL